MVEEYLIRIKERLNIIDDEIRTLKYKHRTVADDHRHVETRFKEPIPPSFNRTFHNNPRRTGKMRMSYESFKEAIERDGMIVAVPVKELERLKRKADYWKDSYEKLLELKEL